MTMAAVVRRVVKFMDGTVGTHTLKVLSVPHEDPEQQKRLTMEEGRLYAEQAGADMSGLLTQPVGRTGLTAMEFLRGFGIVNVQHNIMGFEVERSAATLVQAPPARLIRPS